MKLLQTWDETGDISFSVLFRPFSDQIAVLVRHLLILYSVWDSLTI
jgi:hypothetical protein